MLARLRRNERRSKPALTSDSADGRSAEVIFYNPEKLLVQPGISASVQRYDSASTLGSLASAMPLAGGAIGIGVQYLDFSEDCSVFGMPRHRSAHAVR